MTVDGRNPPGGRCCAGELPIRWDTSTTLWIWSWAPSVALTGTLIITNFRLIFLPDAATYELLNSGRMPPGPPWPPADDRHVRAAA